MINCLECYRCARIGNIAYCPFLEVNPCYRGAHRVVIPPPKQQRQAKPKEAYKLQIPESLKNTKCYPHRHYIFQAVTEYTSFKRISETLRIDPETIRHFVARICEFNNVYMGEVKNCVIE